MLKLFSNLNARELAQFIGDGERATWPKIERLRNQSAISRAFEDCLQILKMQRGQGRYSGDRRRKLS